MNKLWVSLCASLLSVCAFAQVPYTTISDTLPPGNSGAAVSGSINISWTQFTYGIYTVAQSPVNGVNYSVTAGAVSIPLAPTDHTGSGVLYRVVATISGSAVTTYWQVPTLPSPQCASASFCTIKEVTIAFPTSPSAIINPSQISTTGGLNSQVICNVSGIVGWCDANTGAVSSTSLPLTITDGVLSIPAATTSQNGYLTSVDWARFNAKQATITTGTTLQYIDGTLALQTFPLALPPNGSAAGDLSGTYPNPGVATVDGSTAANVHAAELLANAATNLNTANAIVMRDGSGNFAASTVTAALSGNASTATALAALPTPCSSGSAPTGILANGNSTGCASLAPISGATVNAIVTAASATSIQTPSVGATVDSSGNIVVNSLTTATSGSVGGGWNFLEGTCSAGLASNDLICADSTAHRLTENANNAGKVILSGIASAGVAGNCPQFATNGIDIVDSGSTNCGVPTNSIVYFGADPTGVKDSTAAIQTALNTYQDIYCPSGTFSIQPITHAGTGSIISAIIPNAGNSLTGDSNCTFRIANSAGPYDEVFYQPVSCDSCTFQGFTVDSNVANNPLANSAESAAHPRIEFALLGGNNIKFLNVTVKNSTSRNSIWLPPNSGVSSNFLIEGNSFLNMGDDPNHIAHDSSAIYVINTDGVRIANNYFQAAEINSPAGNVGIEAHTSDTVVSGNSSLNYNSLLIVSGIASTTLTNVVVDSNTVNGAIYGINWNSAQLGGHTSGYGLDGVTISHNKIRINQLSYTTSSAGVVDATNPQGIAFQTQGGTDLPMRNLTFTDNDVTFDTETTFRQLSSNSLGIGGVGNAATSLENVICSSNRITNAPVAGIRFSNFNAHSIMISGNKIRDANTLVTTNYKTNSQFTDVITSGGAGASILNLTISPGSWVSQVAISGSGTSALNGTFQVTSVGTGCATGTQCLGFTAAGLANGTYTDPANVVASPVLNAERVPIISNETTADDTQFVNNQIWDDQTTSTIIVGMQMQAGSATSGPQIVNGNTIDITDATHSSWSAPWTVDTNTSALIQQVLPSGITYSPAVTAKAGSNLVTYSGSTPTNWYTALTGSSWNTAPFGFANSFLYTNANSPVTVNQRVFYQLCNATAGNVVFNLPSIAAAGTGFVLTFKKTDSSANTCTINRAGSDTIDGSANVILSTQFKYVTIMSFGGALNVWNIVGSN